MRTLRVAEWVGVVARRPLREPDPCSCTASPRLVQACTPCLCGLNFRLKRVNPLPRRGARSSTSEPRRCSGAAPLLALGVVAGLLLWAYWPSLTVLVGRWSAEPQYSHGYLVVPFALVLLWTRRQSLPSPLPGRSAW